MNFMIFCWILQDFTDLLEIRGSATARNIRSPAGLNWEFALTCKLDNLCIIDLQHHHERHGKYRLEDEELTHLGQSLGEIDKFEDVQLSDDDDDDNVDKEDAGKSYTDLLVKIAYLLMLHVPFDV